MSRQATPPTPASTTKRCAIYTRKSTTMGLEQEFNSLDAQRESALAYIRRQPGWTLVDTHYDDGGFTGANIERPAFQRLLADIEGLRAQGGRWPTRTDSLLSKWRLDGRLERWSLLPDRR